MSFVMCLGNVGWFELVDGKYTAKKLLNYAALRGVVKLYRSGGRRRYYNRV